MIMQHMNVASSQLLLLNGVFHFQPTSGARIVTSPIEVVYMF